MSILFLCTSNAVRSPMAAALARRRFGRGLRIESAGVEARAIDPFAVAVMAEDGIDLSDHEPRTFASFGADRFELIVTLTPEAHQCALGAAPGSSHTIEHWPILDPTLVRDRGHPRSQVVDAYCAVRDQLKARILALTPPKAGPNPG